jgi:hypothetical protein
MYRISLLIIGLSLVAAGCSDSNSSPSAPSQGTTTTTTYTVPLSADNQVPAITNADAGSSGMAIIALTAKKNGSGDVTSATANFQFSVSGLPAGTTVTDAHIHNGNAGANAGVFVAIGLTAGELAVNNGSGSVTKNGISVPVDKATAILSNPTGHYFNVHTALNPAGTMRGQLSGGGATVTTSNQ